MAVLCRVKPLQYLKVAKLLKYKNMDNSPISNLNFGEREMEGLKEMKTLNSEFLKKNEACQAVQEFLSKAQDDDALLLRFLIGRKYRAKYAWETLKRNAEVQFVDYPDLYQGEVPEAVLAVLDNFTTGILKARDSNGRRVVFINTNLWDADKLSMDTLTMVAARAMECVILDEDCIQNGIVLVQDSGGMGMKHVKHYTVYNIKRFVSLLWYAYPIKVKGFYFMNVPYFLTFLYKLGKSFLPKKAKERLLISPVSKQFELLHELIPPKDLPKCFGGDLETEEAVEREFFQFR